MSEKLLCVLILVSMMWLMSCKKESALADCARNSTFARKIVNQKAIIKEMGALFYIFEEGTIDTKLIPCTLEKDFQLTDLPVTISGEVRVASQAVPGPVVPGF